MIPDTDTIQVEVFVNGAKYISSCIEEFLSDEIPCSYACGGENPGKIRNIKQVRARSAIWEEVLEEHAIWKTIQYGARHKLGHGRGLCQECKKLGITPQSPPGAIPP